MPCRIGKDFENDLRRSLDDPGCADTLGHLATSS
jgi:hypothetical protein